MGAEENKEMGVEDTEENSLHIRNTMILLALPVGVILDILVTGVLYFAALLFAVWLLADVIYTRSTWESSLAISSIFVLYFTMKHYHFLVTLDDANPFFFLLELPVIFIELLFSYGLAYLYVASRE